MGFSYELISYVWRELQVHLPSATYIDAEMMVGKISNGTEGLELVERFRLPPSVAAMVASTVRSRLA